MRYQADPGNEKTTNQETAVPIGVNNQPKTHNKCRF